MVPPKRKTILFLAANPSDTTRLRLGAEVTKIQAGLAQSTYRDQFAFEQVWATTPKTMQGAILKVRPDIVHFSGHGSGEDGLILEDDAGKRQWVTTQALSGLFELFADSVDCVVLNACYSEDQSQAIATHIPFTIGMNQAIGDTAAIEFAVGFYTALGEGRELAWAFKYGCSMMTMQGISEGLTPVFIRRSSLGNSSLGNSPLSGALPTPPVIPGKQGTPSDSRDILLFQPEVSSPEPEGDNAQPPTQPPPQHLSISPEDIRQDAQDGAVDINSRLYVRSHQEDRACQAIQRPGALVRIKSPHGMGKSSLTIRVLAQCKAQNHRTVTIDFNQTNARFFEELDKFAQWFCASVGKPLGIRVKVTEDWDDIFGPNDNCTDYFEQHLLTGEPLTLALENFDRLFDHPDIEVDFCGLLRGWHEKAKRDERWGQLRLMIVYSQESYEPKDINQSPFNVGFLAELGPWTALEVNELAARHGLDLDGQVLDSLMALTGGHPQLVRLTLTPLALGEMSLPAIKATAATEAGIYRAHLLERLSYLERRPELKATMKQIVDAEEPIRVKSQDAYKLASMGLVRRQNNDVEPLCEVYRAYFRERLA